MLVLNKKARIFFMSWPSINSISSTGSRMSLLWCCLPRQSCFHVQGTYFLFRNGSVFPWRESPATHVQYKIQSSQVSSPRTNLRILHGPMDSPSFPLIPLSLKAQGSGVRKKNESGSSHVAKGLVRGESVTFPGLDKGRLCFF